MEVDDRETATESGEFSRMQRTWLQVRAEFGKAVVHQDELIEQLLISVLSGGIRSWWGCLGLRSR